MHVWMNVGSVIFVVNVNVVACIWMYVQNDYV